LFRAGLRAFFAELDKVTLADIVANGPVLLERLESNREALATGC
jgi:Rrf2 family nitric oxide-sensitive transcriptional repressor